MKTMKILLPIAAVLLLAGQAAAQDADDESAREAEAREAAYAEELRAAEEQLEEAARRLMELSKERLESQSEMEFFEHDFRNKPRLGVNISSAEAGPVEGVGILSVSPGSAADDAGMRAGDIITAVNGEPMTAETSLEANKRLLDFMKGVEGGDQLDVEYLRDGKVGTVQIEPRVVEQSAVVWTPDGRNFNMPQMPEIHIPNAAFEQFRLRLNSFRGFRGDWGDMEVVELTEGLGRYFGADSGLLVISAPASNAYQLQEGDVIQKIDGREPSSVNHCMRILGSYQPGEKLVLSIMRDKKAMQIEVEIPDDRTSQLFDELIELVKPARAPLAAPAPVQTERT